VVSFEPLASRLTDDQLKELSMASTPQGERRPPVRDFVNIMAQRALKARISEFAKNEGVAVILNSAGVLMFHGQMALITKLVILSLLQK
jgi:hypothetical protein